MADEIACYFNFRLILLLLVIPVTVPAQDVTKVPFFRVAEGSAALGGGIRVGQNPYIATDNEDQRKLDFIPLYLYEGKYFFARGVTGGVHLLRNDTVEVNLLGQYRFQKLDPASHSYFAGLKEREQTLDAGVEVALKWNRGELKLDWVTDTLNRHNGSELQLSYRYRIEAGPWTFSPYLGWTRQNANLTNYYFGISEEEARPDRRRYLPGESTWVSFGLNSSWRAFDRFVLFGNVGFGGADSGVVNSPLVEDGSFSAAFVGGTYMFGNARQPDYIVDDDRVGEWSWRVNYGYQADGNIVSEIDQGNFHKSNVADTTISGLTFSKLLADGDGIDFLGRLAMFRHYEKDEGNGSFSSYAAYIMARGKGYSRWSKEEVFRWGFGFGMSHAIKVPIVEQRKQASKSGNTSHFLNYLEMTLDFPLRRVSKAGWLQRCYAGLTVVHRSGIFGTSDFLGDVAGGSDWITAHLECNG